MPISRFCMSAGFPMKHGPDPNFQRYSFKAGAEIRLEGAREAPKIRASIEVKLRGVEPTWSLTCWGKHHRMNDTAGTTEGF